MTDLNAIRERWENFTRKSMGMIRLRADAEFHAHASDDIRVLLDEVKRLKQDVGFAQGRVFDLEKRLKERDRDVQELQNRLAKYAAAALSGTL